MEVLGKILYHNEDLLKKVRYLYKDTDRELRHFYIYYDKLHIENKDL